MDNTALHTFLFHCPAALRSVALLGSWDNFTKPYHLKIDSRRGRYLWKGCFTFSDIICDGDLDTLSPKRDGPLKMGGTYWYYYKVDDEEESHNPTEPSTTFCPLLPGQRLNVLEVPMEGHSCRSSENPDAFTRNPKDRFLTPVPPIPSKPLSSPRHGDTSSLPYNTLMALPWAPKSATYPPADRLLSPNVVRHARSASASPQLPSTPLFAEFKGLKEKIISKRPRSRSRSETKELEIGPPVLISTSIDNHDLIPLSPLRPPPSPSRRDMPQSTDRQQLHALRREFAPLGSHPINYVGGTVPGDAELPINQDHRPQLHMPLAVIADEPELGSGRLRANSVDTRRTEQYFLSNSPWLSSPMVQSPFDKSTTEVADVEHFDPAPVLQRPPVLLELPSVDERPTSSHDSRRNSGLWTSIFEKALPALPQSLVPAPQPTRDDSSLYEMPVEEPQHEQRPEENQDDDDIVIHFTERLRSHFSTWSSESFGISYPNSDDEAVQSPTFSSLASDCSSPRRLSTQSSYAEQRCDADDDLTDIKTDDNTHGYLSTAPPQLDQLRISMFGPNLFNLETQHTDTALHRQATCFGLGFQGYSLPKDADSKSTITATEIAFQPEPATGSQRDSAAGHLERLMDEFGYLGDAVV